MNKKRHKNELDADFIGGEELTEKEEALLKDYFAKKKKQRKGKGKISAAVGDQPSRGAPHRPQQGAAGLPKPPAWHPLVSPIVAHESLIIDR